MWEEGKGRGRENLSFPYTEIFSLAEFGARAMEVLALLLLLPVPSCKQPLHLSFLGWVWAGGWVREEGGKKTYRRRKAKREKGGEDGEGGIPQFGKEL